MKKILRLLYILALSLFAFACAEINNPDKDKSGDKEPAEQIDYASQLKLDMTTSSAK